MLDRHNFKSPIPFIYLFESTRISNLLFDVVSRVALLRVVLIDVVVVERNRRTVHGCRHWHRGQILERRKLKGPLHIVSVKLSEYSNIEKKERDTVD